MIQLGSILAPLVAMLTGATLSGTVRSSDDGAPLAGVLVRLGPVVRSAITDARGAYIIRDLDAGRYAVRAMRAGFRSRDLAVTVVEGDALHLDLVLEPIATPLAPIAVRAPRREGSDEALPPAFRELGVRSVDGERLRTASALGEPDALAALASSPGVAFDREHAASLHVHGGDGDQTLLLLDGAPVYVPYHFGSTIGSIDPDVLQGLELHAGVPSAAWGGGLSGILAARTRRPDPVRTRASGSIGATGAHVAVDGPIGRGGLGFVLGARSEYPSLFTPRGDDSHLRGSGRDVLGKLVASGGWGETELLLFHSDNAVRFPVTSNLDALPPATPSLAASDAASGPVDRGSHRFDWRGETYALRWSAAPHDAGRMVVQLWHADLDAGAEFGVAPWRARMRSARSGDGVSATWAHALATGVVDGGVAIEQGRFSYAVRGGTGGPAMALEARSHSTSLFVEHRLAGARWQTSVGVRARAGDPEEVGLEPRVALGYRIGRTLSIGAGFARTRQDEQSLRNPASIVSALFVADLPVAAGSAGAPLARADQLVLELQAEPGARTSITVEAYRRTLDGLVLTAPATALPFVVDRFRVGSGRASGVGVSLAHHADRLTLEGAYDFGVSMRRASLLHYAVGHQARHSFLGTIALGTPGGALFRTSLLARSGAPATLSDGALEWEACDPLRAGCETAGTPLRPLGPLDAIRTPPYMRLDVGARREWSIRLAGRRGVLGGHVSLANLLGRRNVWAYASSRSSPGARVGIVARRRSLLAAGLDWRF